MDSWIVSMMLGGSLFLGAIALMGFLWAVKNGQFDDEEKFLNATKFDSVEDLNDAREKEKKERFEEKELSTGVETPSR